jgi:hypothetical protein
MVIPMKIKGRVLDVLTSRKGKKFANVYANNEMYRIFLEDGQEKQFKVGEEITIDCIAIADSPYIRVA